MCRMDILRWEGTSLAEKIARENMQGLESTIEHLHLKHWFVLLQILFIICTKYLDFKTYLNDLLANFSLHRFNFSVVTVGKSFLSKTNKSL